jgi:hypothetical protein
MAVFHNVGRTQWTEALKRESCSLGSSVADLDVISNNVITLTLVFGCYF